jgi:hypothetical protein
MKGDRLNVPSINKEESNQLRERERESDRSTKSERVIGREKD